MPRPKKYKKVTPTQRAEIFEKLDQGFSSSTIYQEFQSRGEEINQKTISSITSAYTKSPYKNFKIQAVTLISDYLLQQTCFDIMIKPQTQKNITLIKKLINTQINELCSSSSQLKDYIPQKSVDTQRRRPKNDIKELLFIKFGIPFNKQKQQKQSQPQNQIPENTSFQDQSNQEPNFNQYSKASYDDGLSIYFEETGNVQRYEENSLSLPQTDGEDKDE